MINVASELTIWHCNMSGARALHEPNKQFKEQKNRDTIVPKSADKFIRCWKWKILVIFGNLKLVRERVYLCCSCYVGWIRILRDKEEEGI